MYDLVSLGEVMLRLSPPGYIRIRQTSSFEVNTCGAQFNIVANLALLGRRTAFLTKLPANEVGLLTRDSCQRYGVDMSHVQYVPDTRVGVIYVEFGLEPRTSSHIYDRQNSAASTVGADDFAWADILEDATLAYTDGIFPAISTQCQAATFEYVHAAKAQGCTVCFDVNFRETLWSPAEAKVVWTQILPYVDVLVTNRSVSEIVFDYQGNDGDLLRHYRDEFGCRTVCLPSRQISGTRRGAWQSIALHEDKVIEGRRFEFDIVDRFGTGDAFFAGFLHGYLENKVEFALNFGNALCALAHTIQGDTAHISLERVEALLQDNYASEIKR